MSMEYFCCYNSYAKKVAKLSDQEVGRLFRALLEYSSTGEAPELTGREAVAFDFIADDIDRAKDAYAAKCARNAKNGTNGGRPSKPNGFDENRTVISETQKNRAVSDETQKSQDKDKDKDKDKYKDEEEKRESKRARDAERHAYGTYGWVRLTDGEYSRLLMELGESELRRCISYIDESAQSSGNKNRWKDWNLVIRRCSREKWGHRKQGQDTSNPFLKMAMEAQHGEYSETFGDNSGCVPGVYGIGDGQR